MELKILDWIQTLRTPLLDQMMVVITALGNKGAIWLILSAILILISKTRKIGTTVAISLLLEVVCCNVILKPLVARVRPCDVNLAVQLLIAHPTDFSFPSGHTGASFAAASALYFRKNRFWVPAGILAVLIAFSRLYLYVHYPSDVLVGVMLGIMLGWLGNLIVDLAIYRRQHGR